MKLLKYLVIRLTTRHAVTAIDIYERIYNPRIYSTPEVITNKSVGSVTSRTSSNKKQEFLESLQYLKSKPIKTKKDKDSISMLEGILSNM